MYKEGSVFVVFTWGGRLVKHPRLLCGISRHVCQQTLKDSSFAAACGSQSGIKEALGHWQDLDGLSYHQQMQLLAVVLLFFWQEF